MIKSFEVAPPLGNQTERTTPAPNPNRTTPTNDTIVGTGGIVVIVIIIIAVLWGFKSRGGKYKERHGFSESVKQKPLEKQHHRCAKYKRLLTVLDFDHKNGNRSDNRVKL